MLHSSSPVFCPNVYNPSSCSKKSVAGPGLAVSSVIASRSAGTKLTSLAEILVFLPCFLQKSHFQTPRDTGQPCRGGRSRGQALFVSLDSARASRVVSQCPACWGQLLCCLAGIAFGLWLCQGGSRLWEKQERLWRRECWQRAALA